ncbi:MAG: Gmad2 immunoglobulin-like domain-containing protein [Alphaproteobacteria bacterium]|nr:Gmad2 immunoglobulin-like domain-containing protein [Alphaproteobacteria bacterium]
MLALLLTLACTRPPAPEPTPAPPVTEPAPEPTPEPTPQPPAGPVAIAAPAEGARLAAGPFTISGTAKVWEGQLTVRLVDAAGEVLDTQAVTADAAAPGQGSWSATLTVPEGATGAATIEAFTRSAKDGSEENKVAVAVTLP